MSGGIDLEGQQALQRANRQRSASNVMRLFNPRAFVPERVNAQISKRYNIDTREVGCGGFGKVFVADDREVKGRKVAIKKIVATSREMRTSFEREVGLMKELDHPNICKILETYENGRVLWVVMEYCEGGEVFERIMEHGTIEEGPCADIIKQVAGALLYAHSRGIAHRDLKPENVVFCDRGFASQVKVIDWGVGCHFASTGMHSAVGSATYAAPEVLQAEKRGDYAAACDLWSLGVMAYVMLSGKPPFWGNLTDQVKKMNKEQYPMNDHTWTRISAYAKDFIRNLLRADPSKRLSIQAALQHRWLSERRHARAVGEVVSTQVLTNMRHFGNTPHFHSIIAASVAKQLDHRSLEDVRRVFAEMDSNGDGVLELPEVRKGFEKIFGVGSEQLRDLGELFARLDLDGSGRIDYTEFCAAGLGIGGATGGCGMPSEIAMRAAFKSFDVNDDDGRLSRDELRRVLMGADIGQAWSKEVCEQVTEEIFERFDTDKDGSLDFQEWLRMMHDSSVERSGSGSLRWLDEPLEGPSGIAAAAAACQAEAHPTRASSGPTLLQGGRRMRANLATLGIHGPKDCKEQLLPAQQQQKQQQRSLLGRVTDMFSRSRLAEGRRAPSIAPMVLT